MRYHVRIMPSEKEETMKKIFKKLPIIALCFACALALTGCAASQSQSSASSSESSSSASANSAESSSAASSPAATPAGFATNVDPISVGDNVLVVYYSATGNTDRIAQMVAQDNSATLYQVKPDPDYSSEDLNYNDTNSRVSREHEEDDLIDAMSVNAQVPDWDSYDTVFIGYPIWWGEAAFPIQAFVKANDFTGKNVIPFCTSASSGIGDSVEELADETETGQWAIGMRFASSATQEEINAWLESMVIAL